MSEHTFRAMGTEWFLRADGCSVTRLHDAQRRVEREEHRFSRFLPQSVLSRLNQNREVHDAVLASVVRHALRFRQATRGAFDPCMGAQIAAVGYDRPFDALGEAANEMPREASERPQVVVRGSMVRLIEGGTLDLGGIVKGWMVDRLAKYLEDAGVRAYVIDGGGDIRVGEAAKQAPDGNWSLGAGEGRVLALRARSVATSSTLRRRWRVQDGEAHHILTPRTGFPATTEFVSATVVAPEAMTADVLGTALIADPNSVLPVMRRFEADALLQHRDGSWVMTQGMERWLAA